MKKYLHLIWAGVLATLALSCNKETETPETPVAPAVPVEMTFEAGNDGTKTSLGADKAVLWSAGDGLSVFDSELTNNRFTQSSLSSDYTSASYNGLAVESETYYAVYPWRAVNSSAAEGEIDTYLTPDQFAVANSFGVGANLALGVSVDNGSSQYFVMQQVGAFVKFSFSGCSTVTSICLKAIGGEKIAGGVTAVCTDGSFDAVAKNDGSALDEVTLYPASGEDYIAPGTYYAVMLPVTLESGLQVLFTEKTGGVEKVIAAKIPSSIALTKNTVSAVPNEIVLPDVSNAAWMEQETINVLFKEPWHLLDGEGTAALPFEAPESYSSQTVNVDGYTIGVNFGSKTPGLSSTSGFYVSSGTNNGWYFSLPVVSGKKLVKVEYYTSALYGANNPCITNMAKGYNAIYGAVNSAGAAYAKYIWNLNLGVGCWVTWYGDESHKGNVTLNGFRAIYRDAEGPAKSVISVSTDSYGAFVDQDVVLKGSFVAYDGTATGYTYGFEYKAAGGPVAAYSSGESFYDGENYGLRSGQAGEWTSVEGTVESGTAFSATLNSLTRGQAYTVRAWACVGEDGERVYGEEEEIGLLSKVSSGQEWKYGEDEFFTVWKACSNNASDLHNCDWEGRLADGNISAYKYGAGGLFYETTSTAVEFRAKNYLKFGTNQKFSFISSESGTATLTMVCKSTSSSARSIYVAVNGTRVETFESSISDYSPVTSGDFSVNEGDKVSITINNNANLQAIAFACVGQEGSFAAAVDDASKADRNTVYNFTVTASADLAWTAAVTTGAGDGVVLSKTEGTGSDSFTLTVPVNYKWASSDSYAVTVSTTDERIAEGNRSQVINLTQAQPTKVLFGCQWGSSFLSTWNTAGFTENTPFEAQLATAQASNSLTTGGSGYMRGNPTFIFIAGESGNARLTFRARVYSQSNKTNYFRVFKTSGGVQTKVGEIVAANASVTETKTVDFAVLEGDEVKITYSGGSGNHYLYCGDTYPITWNLAE